MKTNKQDKIQVGTTEIRDEKTGGMPIFKCSCGASILVVPDLPEMDRAIKTHMVEHKKATGHRLDEDVIIQLMIKTITEYQFRT